MNTTRTIIHRKYPLLSAEHPAEALALRAGAATLLAFVCLYLYFVSASVLNVIASSEAEHRAAALEGAMGVLQQEYFALARGISAEAAADAGLAPVVETSYAHRPGDVGIASPSEISNNNNAL